MNTNMQYDFHDTNIGHMRAHSMRFVMGSKKFFQTNTKFTQPSKQIEKARNISSQTQAVR